jgi:hypothetical protein
MKTREILSLLQKAGYRLVAANKHYKYSNGINTICVPRHKLTNKYLAKDIIKAIGA